MKLVIFWIRQLVFGVWCLKLHGVSASTSQSILGKCQHLVTEAQSWTGRGLLSNEASWQWAASIPLQVSALTAKVLSNPVTQGFAHILSIFFPSPGTRREIRPLRQVQRPIPKWLIFENIGSFHSPWYLIESCLCKAPSRFAWWSQHSAAPQTAEQREQEAVRALCPRTRYLVTGLCLWLALFGGHVAPPSARAVMSQTYNKCWRDSGEGAWAEVCLAVSLLSGRIPGPTHCFVSVDTHTCPGAYTHQKSLFPSSSTECWVIQGGNMHFLLLRLSSPS